MDWKGIRNAQLARNKAEEASGAHLAKTPGKVSVRGRMRARMQALETDAQVASATIATLRDDLSKTRCASDAAHRLFRTGLTQASWAEFCEAMRGAKGP